MKAPYNELEEIKQTTNVINEPKELHQEYTSAMLAERTPSITDIQSTSRGNKDREEENYLIYGNPHAISMEVGVNHSPEKKDETISKMSKLEFFPPGIIEEGGMMQPLVSNDSEQILILEDFRGSANFPKKYNETTDLSKYKIDTPVEEFSREDSNS